MHIGQGFLISDAVAKAGFSPERDRLAKLLRKLRAEAGLRQTDLAEKLGEPQSYVSKYESGEQRLDLLELRSICLALGTDLGRLVKRFEGER